MLNYFKKTFLKRIFESFALALSTYCLLTPNEGKKRRDGIKRTAFKEYTKPFLLIDLSRNDTDDRSATLLLPGKMQIL